MPSRSYRLQVPLPEDWREVIEREAAAAGVPVAEWVRSCIFCQLPRADQQRLGDVRPGRPTKPGNENGGNG